MAVLAIVRAHGAGCIALTHGQHVSTSALVAELEDEVTIEFASGTQAMVAILKTGTRTAYLLKCTFILWKIPAPINKSLGHQPNGTQSQQTEQLSTDAFVGAGTNQTGQKSRC